MSELAKRCLTRKGIQTHDRVVQAGIECIAELGFHAASTNKIAARAGVTWGTLQHQFGDKVTLLEAILEAAYVSQAAAIFGSTTPEAPLKARISVLLDAFWQEQTSPASTALADIIRSVVADPEYRDRFLPQLQRLRDSYNKQWNVLFADVALSKEMFEATKQLAFAAIRGLALEIRVRSSDRSILAAKALLASMLFDLLSGASNIDANAA
jgi:AcrR family transcriptional regulator